MCYIYRMATWFEAFLNWLPVTQPLQNYMRPLASQEVGAGLFEYVFDPKEGYWSSDDTARAYLQAKTQ